MWPVVLFTMLTTIFSPLCEGFQVGQCKADLEFHAKINFDDPFEEKSVEFIKAFKTPTPLQCMQDCCNSENCNAVTFSLGKNLDNENCFLYNCEDECPTVEADHAYVYTIIKSGTLTTETVTTKAATTTKSTTTSPSSTTTKSTTKPKTKPQTTAPKTTSKAKQTTTSSTTTTQPATTTASTATTTSQSASTSTSTTTTIAPTTKVLTQKITEPETIVATITTAKTTTSEAKTTTALTTVSATLKATTTSTKAAETTLATTTSTTKSETTAPTTANQTVKTKAAVTTAKRRQTVNPRGTTSSEAANSVLISSPKKSTSEKSPQGIKTNNRTNPNRQSTSAPKKDVHHITSSARSASVTPEATEITKMKSAIEHAVTSMRNTTRVKDIVVHRSNPGQGIPVTFTFFGILIVVATLYIVTKNIRQGLKRSKYRGYNQIRFHVTDRRWRV